MRLLTVFPVIFMLLPADPSDARPVEAFRSIGLTNSGVMGIHALSMPGLPAEALESRAALLRQAGFAGDAGLVDARLRFSPVLGWDPNINGGLSSDTLDVAGLTFRIAEGFKAVSGVVAGLSAQGHARWSLGGGRRFDLHYGASAVHAPRENLSKLRAFARGCLGRIIGSSTLAEGCASADWQRAALGTAHRIGAEARLSRAFTGRRAFHEMSGHLGVNRHGGRSTIAYTQAVGGLRWTAALPGEVAVSLGLDLGSRIRATHAMRQRLSASLTTRAAGRPLQAGIAVQRNRGGLFLGEERRSTIASLNLGIEPRENLLVSVGVSRTRARHSFFDDRTVGLSVSWRF